MTDNVILVIAGVPDFNNREDITDGIVDALCDLGPTMILTSDDEGELNDIVAELLAHVDIPHEKFYREEKNGSPARQTIIRDTLIAVKATHIIDFGGSKLYDTCMKRGVRKYEPYKEGI